MRVKVFRFFLPIIEVFTMTSATGGRFTADGLPVLIGSVPLTDHAEALEWIFAATPEIPLWPQLPHNPLERMMPQFGEGVPCIVEENLGDPEGRLVFDIAWPGFEEAMLAFYEEYLAVQDDPSLLDNSRFAVSRQRAEGLFLFCDALAGKQGLRAVKGQVTGPFTMLTGIKDRQGRAGYFDETIRDMVIKAMAMKAAWQTRLLARAASVPVLMFIDEPALAGLGSSAFISVTDTEIRTMIDEVADAVHQAGGLAGIHVCANTNWSILLGSKIDIISFDAHGFFDRMAALKDEVDTFLKRGSIIAWGGVPTSRVEEIEQESVQSLTGMFKRQMAMFTGPARDMAALLAQTLITPSCGTGSIPEDAAQKVLSLTRETASVLRDEFL
jgi:methionine synthase II (cobalamin-independent)